MKKRPPARSTTSGTAEGPAEAAALPKVDPLSRGIEHHSLAVAACGMEKATVRPL